MAINFALTQRRLTGIIPLQSANDGLINAQNNQSLIKYIRLTKTQSNIQESV